MSSPPLTEIPKHPAPLASRAGVTLLAVFVVASLLSLALAWSAGGAVSGFGAYEDEPAHLVTGLMVRDYLVDAAGSDPMEFAKRYYVHYPKVAIGHWPPGFPAIVGAWVALFGDSHLALLSLMSLLAGSTAALLFAALRGLLGQAFGLTAAVLFVLVPRVQAYTFSVMTELPLALSCTLAVVGFGFWLDRPRRRYLALFAAASIVAIYTKGSALFLALLPPLSIALSGRWERLRSRDLWIAGLAVGLLCAPWYLFTIEVSRTTWGGGGGPNWDYTSRAIPVYFTGLMELTGYLGGLLVVVGVFTGHSVCRGLWAVWLGWIVCHLIGLLSIPTGEDARHLVALTPAWIALSLFGARALGDRFGWKPELILLPFLLVFAVVWERPTKDYRGYETAAEAILDDPGLAHSYLLVASDSTGEGLFIGDIAIREPRPGHVVLRASKFLGSSDWLGGGYEPRYESVEALAAALEELPVGVVALDRATKAHHWFLHHEQLSELFRSRPDQWRLMGAYDIWRAGVHHPGALELYRQVGHEDRIPGEIDFEALVGRDLPTF